MDITLLELHVDDGFDFSPSSSFGGSEPADSNGSDVESTESSSRGRMAALGVLVLLAVLALGAKRMMGSDMEELEDLDEIPA